MHYKSILVHVDTSAHAAARYHLAASIAQENDAHLIGAATTGMSRELFRKAALGAELVDFDMLPDMLRRKAETALDQFETVARGSGLSSYERRIVEADAVAGMCLHALYSDLVILTQDDPQDASLNVNAGFPDLVLLHASSPVIVLPTMHDYRQLGRRILLAWDASPEARKAVQYSLPLLNKANIVHIVVFNSEQMQEADGADPGADLAVYLARHGVKVELLHRSSDANAGPALISLSNDLDSDLVVMGAYGHSRLHEAMLGGVTRTMLKSMTAPVFFAH